MGCVQLNYNLPATEAAARAYAEKKEEKKRNKNLKGSYDRCDRDAIPQLRKPSPVDGCMGFLATSSPRGRLEIER